MAKGFEKAIEQFGWPDTKELRVAARKSARSRVLSHLGAAFCGADATASVTFSKGHEVAESLGWDGSDFADLCPRIWDFEEWVTERLAPENWE